MEYKLIHSLSEKHQEELMGLYKGLWWSDSRLIEDVKIALKNSTLLFGFVNNQDNLFAFGRVLSDKVYKALILDIIVREDYRNKQFGKKLFEEIINHEELKNVNHFELFCKDDLVPFYQKFGFQVLQGENEMRKQKNS